MSIERNILLTPNFRLAEFLHKDSPLPPLPVLENLYRVANRLQVIRDLLGKPITITSGWRTLEHNKAVGGAPNSMHLSGMAVDIVISGMTPKQVQDYLKNWNGGLGYGSTFTHLDIRPTKTRWVY